MSENIRDLAIGIGWRIDDRALKKADRETDRYRDSVADVEDEIHDLGRMVSRIGSDMEDSFNDVGRSALELGGKFGRTERMADGAFSGIESSITDVRREATRTEQEVREIGQGARDAQREIGRATDRMEEDIKGLRSVIEGIDWGALAGSVAGGASLGVISGVETSVYDLQARLGATREEAEALRGVALDVFENNFAGSIAEATSGVELLKQVTGEEGIQLQGLTEDVFRITDAWGQDFREVVDAARANAASMGIDFGDALDVVATGFQNGLNVSDDWLDTVREFSPSFARIGEDAGGMISILREGLDLGIRDTDRMAESINEFGIRMQEVDNDELFALAQTITGTEKEAQSLMETWQKEFAKGGDSAAQITREVVESLYEIEEPLVQNALGIGLFGTMWEDTSGKVGQALLNAQNKTTELIDTTTALDVQYDNTTSKIQAFGRQVLGEAIGPLEEMGDTALTAFQGVLTLGTGLLGLKGLGLDVGKMAKGLGGKLFKFGGGAAEAATAGTEATAGSSLLRSLPRGLGKIAGRAAIPLAVGLSVYDIATAEEGERGTAIGRGVGGLGGAAAGAALGSVIPGVGTVIGGIVGGILGSFGGGELGDWIQGLDFSALGDKVREAKDDAVNWLKQLPGEAAEQLGYMTGRAATELQELPGEFSAWFKQSKDNAIQWVSALPGEIGEFLSSIPSQVTESVGRIWDSFMELGSSIPDAILSGFNRAKEGLGSVGNWVVDKVSQGIEGVKSLGQRFGEGFERGSVPAHAIGGIFGRPHMALFAEAGREAVIPIDQHRNRALDLWAETGRLLGVQAFAKGGFIGQIREAFTPSATPAVAAAGAGGPVFQSYVTVEYNGSGSKQDAEQIARTIDRRQEQNFDRLMNKWFRKQAKLRPRTIER